MATSPNRIRLQMLLRPEYRHEKGCAAVVAAVRKLGLTVTGRGLATISATASWDQVAAVFGVEPRAASRDRRDVAGGELAVPAALAESVERVSIAPQHVAMTGDSTAGEREQNETRRKETP